jgi:O-antigen/teichoic acid export membrane protein
LIKTALFRLGKNSFIYGIGGAFNRFIGLFLLPFFTRALSPKDYGVVALLSLIAVVMSGVLSLGTANSMGLLYYKEKDITKRPTIIWSNFTLMVGNGIFWYSIVWLFAPTVSILMFQTSEYDNLIRLAFLASVLRMVVDPWLAFLRMEEKAKQYLFLTVGGAILTTALSALFVLILHLGVVGLLLAGTMGSAIMVGVVWLFVGCKLNFHVDPKLFLPLVRIGFPSIFGLFAFLVIDYADRQMIERMLSLTDLGVYSVGYSFGMVMIIATSAFGTAWPPFFMSYIKKPDEARQVFGRVLTYYVMGCGSLGVLFFFVAKPVLAIMTAPLFHDAWVVVGLVAAGYMLKGCYLILLPGIYFAKKLILQSMIEWIAAMLNLGLNLWLIPFYGILGAAIATFLSYLSLPVLAWLIARTYLKVDYEWSRLALGSALAILTSCVLYQLSQYFSSELFEVILYGMIVCTIYFGTTFMFFLRDGERLFIYRKIGL